MILLRLAATADRAMAFFLRWCVIVGLATLFCLLAFGIVARAVDMSFAARDEIVELVTIWTVLLGVLALWREDALYRVDAIVMKYPGFFRAVRPILELIKLGFAAVLVWKGSEFAFTTPEVTPFLGFDKALIYGSIPAVGIAAALYSVAGFIGSLLRLFGSETTRMMIDGPAFNAGTEDSSG